MSSPLRGAARRGFCGADHKIEAARASLHFWEEPPISGTRGSGAIFFTHCSLRCIYCQNADLSQGKIAYGLDENRLIEICLDLQDQGAHNINFVTPTQYSLDLIEVIKAARTRGLSIPVVWNTSGYERPEVIEALKDSVDIWLVDYKYSDEALAEKYSSARDYSRCALKAIDTMLEISSRPQFSDEGLLTSGVLVRHLVLPGVVDNSTRALEELWGRFNDEILYSLMGQYTPLIQHPYLGRAVRKDEYEAVLDFADSLGMQNYYWQEESAIGTDFIPSWTGEGL